MPIVVDGRVDGFQAILLYWTPKLGCHVGDNDEEQSDTGQGHQWGNVMLINTMLHPSKAQRSEKVSEESQSHNCSRYLLSEGEKKKYIIKKNVAVRFRCEKSDPHRECMGESLIFLNMNNRLKKNSINSLTKVRLGKWDWPASTRDWRLNGIDWHQLGINGVVSGTDQHQRGTKVFVELISINKGLNASSVGFTGINKGPGFVKGFISGIEWYQQGTKSIASGTDQH